MAIELVRGQRLRVIDPQGEQVADLLAYNRHDVGEVLSSGRSLDYASWKDRKALAAAIKPIYTAPSAEAAQVELDAFEAGPSGMRFPTVVASWRRAWDKVIPFFECPPEVRLVMYTTNTM